MQIENANRSWEDGEDADADAALLSRIFRIGDITREWMQMNWQHILLRAVARLEVKQTRAITECFLEIATSVADHYAYSVCVGRGRGNLLSSTSI